MVALAIGFGWLAWWPRPLEMRQVTLEASETPGAIRAIGWQAPRWIVLGGETLIELKVEMPSGAIRGSDLVIARLAGPGLRVDPPGDQLAPAGGILTFGWSVTGVEAGEMPLRPEVSLRSEADTVDRLIWSKASSIDVVSPGGLSANDLGTLSIGLALAGLAVGLSRMRVVR